MVLISGIVVVFAFGILGGGIFGVGIFGGGIFGDCIFGGGIFGSCMFGGGTFIGGKIICFAGVVLIGGSTVGGVNADLFDCKLVSAVDKISIGMLFGMLSAKLIEALVGEIIGAMVGEMAGKMDGELVTTAGDFRSPLASLARRGSVSDGK